MLSHWFGSCELYPVKKILYTNSYGLNIFTSCKERKMPIKKVKGGYKVKNTKTKKAMTKAKAKKQQAAIYAKKKKKK